MARDRQEIGLCSRCSGGAVNCSHNHFTQEALTIHSWEHRCSDCGHRETTAMRSDDAKSELTVDATVCPYCGRQAAGTTRSI